MMQSAKISTFLETSFYSQFFSQLFPKPRIILSSVLLVSSLLIADYVQAQSQPAISITTSTQSAPDSSYTGHNGNTHTWGNGSDVLLEAITTSTGTYSQSLFADNIIVRRVNNAKVVGNRCALFAERTSSVYTLAPSLLCDPATVMSGRIINRGWLDVFSNDQGSSTNRAEGNIERIDFIFSSGIQASSVQATLENSGHIVTEKSGNNPTVMAAITSLNSNGDPDGYAPLVKVWPHNSGQAIRYGKVGASVPFSFLKDGDGVTSGGAAQDGEPEYFGSSSEQLGVAFITLDDLDIALGQTYYGFSYFSQDIYGSSLDPVLYNNFPTTTSGGSSVADADMYGGVAGYFTLGRSISGNVYNDIDESSTNNAGDSNLQNITVRLYSDVNTNGSLDSGEAEIASFITDANGNYSFNVGSNASYLVLVDSNDTDIPAGLSPSGSNPQAVAVITANMTGIDFPFTNTPVIPPVVSNNGVCEVVFEDFGSGSYPGPALPAGHTTYNYNAPPDYAVWPDALADGDYVLSPEGNLPNGNWQAGVTDHTGAGYMYVINAGLATGDFYHRDITLLPNTQYDMSTWAVNLNSAADETYCSANEPPYVLPNLKYEIRDKDTGNTVIASFTTGFIIRDNLWKDFAFTFNTGSATNLEIVVINNGPGGCGNDVAIDDILLKQLSGVDSIGATCGTSFDRSDAPTDMSSIDSSLTSTYGDADHALDGVTYLGTLVDAEASSQSTGLDADGDDTDGTNDDDGVTFPQSGSTSVLRVDTANAITVTASVNGFLNAWIDWNQDGDWNDIGEQIATNAAMTAGNNTLNVTPATTVAQGKTYARFRFTSSSVVAPSPLGSLVDGEVEDYAVSITLASPVNVCSPNLLNNGFEEAPLPSTFFIKAEEEIIGWSTLANSPSSGSNYFQRNSIEIWKSGFLSVPAYQGGYFAEINAYINGSLYQDVELPPGTTVGWSFAHRGRSGVDTIQVNMGAPGALTSQGQFSTGNTEWKVYSGSYTVPAGQTVTRFAFQAVSTANGNTSTGNFIDAVQLPGGCDFGDAPDSYSTKLTSNGAYHIGNTLLYMGAEMADSEIAAFGGDDVDSSGTANDDDAAGDTPDDEDGVSSFATLNTSATTYSVDVTVNNTTGSTANLVGWVDFDGNGSFDTDEAATVAVPTATNGVVSLNWSSVPSDMSAGNSFVRLRLTTDSSVATGTATTSTPNGMASDGEIEDYPLTIVVGGFAVSGRVYNDTDVNGVNDNNETGISGLPVVLLDTASNICISTRTDADGNYKFYPVSAGNYQLYEGSRETVPTPQNCNVTNAKDPAGYRSTTDNVLAQFTLSNADITGNDFGDVSVPLFAPDHSGTVLPGDVVFYTHTFTPKSTGSVNLTLTNSTAAITGWTAILYQDTNCNGQLDGVEGDNPVGSNLATLADTPICLINKVYAPNDVTSGETYSNIINAAFDFNSNSLAGSSLLTVTDISKAASDDESASSKLELRKSVKNMTQATASTETQNQAKPGDTLEYRIYYINTGTAPITDLKVNDAAPAFTDLQASSSSCDITPTGLTCTPVETNSKVEWIFGGALEGGAEGEVSYRILIQ
ncbi:MAG: GEVED domain-containing protein [Thiotrichaceae bacterium]